MDYELAKQLEAAGFPMPPCYCRDDAPADHIDFPSLEELIEACGAGSFMLLTKGDGIWAAAINGKGAEASTPTEAVAKLWLALNSPSKS